MQLVPYLACPKDTEDAAGAAAPLAPRRLPLPRNDGSRGGLAAARKPSAAGSGIQTRRRATRATASKTRVTASSQLRRRSSRKPLPEAPSSSPHAATQGVLSWA